MAIFPNDYVEKITIAADDMVLFSDSEDGYKLKKAKYSNLKWEKWDTGEKWDTWSTWAAGTDWASIVSWAFSWDDIVFTKDDATTVVLENAKLDLKWDTGVAWTDWDDWVWITSITKTWTVWLVDTYTILYTDSTTSTFDITNWKDWTNWTNGTDWVSFTPRWAYDAWTAYVANDVVSYLGSSWTALQNTTGNIPTEWANWTLLAAKGTDWTWAWDMIASVYDPTSIGWDAFDMDNMVEWTTNKHFTATIATRLANTSWTNSWDEDTTSIKTKLWAADTDSDWYLTSTDWNTFNAKQAALVSGTNIKTVWGTTLLWSGDIDWWTGNIGYKNIPQVSKSANYTLVLWDAGKSIDHPSSDANARTFTIPANSSVAYPIGTTISFSNMSSQDVTIAITTDTMYLAWAGTTGSRTLAQYGVATVRKLTATTRLISGVWLT